MMLSWMLHAVLISALLGLAAWAAEGAVRHLGLPTRWAWAMGLLATPVVLILEAVPQLLPRSTLPAAPAVLDPVVALPALAASRVPTGVPLEMILSGAWMFASAAVMLVLVRSWAGMRRRAAGWRRSVVDGVPVLFSRDTGPAVLGLLRPVVVLPAWWSESPPLARRMVLAHEAEHLRKGDGRLTLMGLLVATAFPWNLPLWWQFHRLRNAVEVDCDRRTLRRTHAGVRSYAELLLELAGGGRSGVLAPALSEPGTHLKRRIKMMTWKKPRTWPLRAAGLTGLAAVAAFAACHQSDLPTKVGDEEPEIVVADDVDAEPNEPRFTPYTVGPEIRNGEEVQRALLTEYPPRLRDAGVGGTAHVHLFIDENGEVGNYQIAQSSGYRALDEAALSVADGMRFTPAENRGEIVPVWIQMPITFEVNGADEDSQEEAPSTASGGPDATDAGPFEEVPAEDLAEAPPAGPEEPGFTGSSEADAADAGPYDEVPAEDVAGAPRAGPEEPGFTPYTKSPRVQNTQEVQAALVAEYPDDLRDSGVEGTALVHFFIDETGEVGDYRIAESSGYESFDAAALEVADVMRFTPGENYGEKVPVWIAMPITFEVR